LCTLCTRAVQRDCLSGSIYFPIKNSVPLIALIAKCFPFSSDAVFSLEQLADDLQKAVSQARKQNTVIKDICFSGNGEPTLSPAFPSALKLAQDIQSKAADSARLVIITNGAGLLQPQIFSLLKDAALLPATDIWLKADAGTEDWYKKINRSSIPYEKLITAIKEFTSCSPVTIQTMLCSINGEQPQETEKQHGNRLYANWRKERARLAVSAKYSYTAKPDQLLKTRWLRNYRKAILKNAALLCAVRLKAKTYLYL